MDKDVILLVEDNQSILFNLKLLLEFNDFSVLSATNGIHALDVLTNASKMPSIIISDIVMPEMDGYEFLRKVSENDNWNMIPFIFLSAKASEDEIRLGRYLGADDYLTKPIDETLLLQIIKNKILKARKLESVLQNKVNAELFLKMNEIIDPEQYSSINTSPSLFILEYNNSFKPRIVKEQMDKAITNPQLDKIVIELFNHFVSVFDSNELAFLESLTLKLHTIDLTALIFLDRVNHNTKTKVLVIFAPTISYYNNLRLKNTARSIFEEIKTGSSLDMEYYYNEIQTILIES